MKPSPKQKVSKRTIHVYGIYDALGDGIWREFEPDINKTDALLRKATAILRMPYEKDEDIKSRLRIIRVSISYLQ